MQLSFRAKIIFSRSGGPHSERELPSYILPADFTTAEEAFDAAQAYIAANGYAPGEAACEISDLRGHPEF